jgi:hypothetical protein
MLLGVLGRAAALPARGIAMVELGLRRDGMVAVIICSSP